MLGLQLLQRGRVGVGRLALQRACQVASPSQVAVLQLLGLARIGQPVERVLADRLEQPVTSRSSTWTSDLSTKRVSTFTRTRPRQR